MPADICGCSVIRSLERKNEASGDASEKYVLTSNRESGFGRYDVMLEPRDLKDDAIILEFKVQELGEEKYLIHHSIAYYKYKDLNKNKNLKYWKYQKNMIMYII